MRSSWIDRAARVLSPFADLVPLLERVLRGTASITLRDTLLSSGATLDLRSVQLHFGRNPNRQQKIAHAAFQYFRGFNGGAPLQALCLKLIGSLLWD